MTVTLLDASNATVATETVTMQDTGAAEPVAAPASLEEARARIETALRASSRAEFAGASVRAVDQALVVTPGGSTFSNRFEFTDAAGTAADELNLSNAISNVAAYQPGVGPSTQAQAAGTAGNDGSPPSLTDIQGSRAAKTGIFALEDVDLSS